MDSNRILGRAILASALAMAAGQGAALGQVAFRSEPDQQRVVMNAQQLAQSMRSLSLRAEGSRVVIEFAAPVTPEQRAALAASGVRLLSSLGNNAYFANLEGVRPLAAMNSAHVTSVRPIRTAWKVDELLTGAEPPAHIVVDSSNPADPVVAVYVVFHKDVASESGAELIVGAGGHVRGSLVSVNAHVVEIARSALDALAAHDEVQWIEAAMPQFSELNDSNRVITQVNEVQSAPYSLDGSGVTVLVFDAGSVNNNHADFGGRVTDIDTQSNSTHPTHVAATVGGDGSAQGGRFRGMAPNVDILSAGFEWTGGGIFLYENPGDIEDDYGVAIGMGADMANNSIGSNTEPNGFPCEIQGNYGVTASVIDEIARGSLGEPFIIFWSAGNERQGSRCDIEGFGDYYSSAPPANAKNHITIGALNSNNDSMTSFSSWGPADDGRLKPDMAGPGCQSSDDFGVTSASNSNNGYTALCGTSMSGPTVTGIGALILEDFREQFPGLPNPASSTMKVILAQTAADLGNPGPDYQFGYGSVRARDAIDFMRTAQFTEQTIGQGATQTFTIDVGDGTPELKYTLSWNDPAGTPNVDPALVNNLDVRAIDPSGNIHHAWTLDQFDPGADAVRTGPNTKDNIEQVYVENPQAGEWVIEVIGTNVPEGPQLYSLAGTSLGIPFVGIGLDTELPELLDPNTPLAIEAGVNAINDNVVPGSAQLHYRFDGGSYTAVQLTDQGGGLFTGDIPGAGCDDAPEFYLSVEGELYGFVTTPQDGPNNPFSYGIGTVIVSLSDNFETDMGWTAENLGASSGDWQRGVPVNDPGWDYDPATDGDGSGQCWLTQNEFGNTDVDGGAVRLTSPVFDMSGDGPFTIEYDYYLNRNGSSGNDDSLHVELSSNGGSSWTTIRDHIDDRGSSWTHEVIAQSDLDGAGIVTTDQMRIRYTANDSDPQSIVEAGVDGFTVTSTTCDDGGGCQADLDGDGDADSDDFFVYLDAFAADDLDVCDLDDDGDCDSDDFFAYLDVFAQGC